VVAPPRAASRDGLRAFFALELGDAARAATLACSEQLRALPGGEDVRFVKGENLHVTLRFLGHIAEARIAELVERVSEAIAGIPPFGLTLGAIHAFPNRRRPRVLVREVAPIAPLEGLAAAVERGVRDAGFEGEDRPFRPHLTLGRVRPKATFPNVTAADTPGADAFDVTEIVLFRSELDPSGTRYAALARLPLASPESESARSISPL
jgi:2'-5' RNA ligase